MPLQILRVSVFFLIMCAASANAANESYAAFGLTPQGPTRVTALGGAFVGLSDDISGINYNPAGLAMGDWWGDLGGNVNTVVNAEADVNNDGKLDGIPYQYYYYAGGLKFKSFAFGVGVSSPYGINISFDTPNGFFSENRNLILQLQSVDLPFSYRLSEQISVGICLHGETLLESYKMSSTNPVTAPIDVKTQKQMTYISAGVSWWPSKTYGLGLAGSPERTYSVDDSLNAQIDSGIQWFKPVIVPAKVTLGSFYRPNSTWLFVFDVDYVAGVKNAVWVGSSLVPGFRRVEIDDTPKVIAHGGAEWHLVATKDWDFFARGGLYNEPPRVRGNKSRQHTTLGFDVRWWLFTLGGAVDAAEDYINFAAGIGISLKSYL